MAFSYYATVTVDNTKVSGSTNLTNFPMLISGTYDSTDGEPDLRTAANGGEIQNTATGGVAGNLTVPADLAFYSDSGLTTQLDHEFVAYNASTGAITVWVEIPTLDYNDDTVIYMAYGDSGQESSMEDIAGTWGAYNGVWHLDGSYNGTAGEVKDSCGTNNGTSVNTPTQQAGIVVNEQQFNGSSQWIDLGDVTTWDGATAMTILCWINADNASSGQIDELVRKLTGAQPSFLFQCQAQALAGNEYQIMAGISDGTNRHDWCRDYDVYAPLSSSTDYYVGMGWDYNGGSPVYEIYLDGVSQTVKTAVDSGTPTSINNSSERLGFAARYNAGSTDGYHDGSIDEIRMASAKLGVDWVLTEYNSQTLNSFYAMGNETAWTPPAAGGATPTGHMTTNTKFWGT